MQLWHLASLALVPICFATFRMVSETHDPSRALVDNVVIMGGVFFSAYSLVFMVITGKSDDALPSLLKLYRQSLARPSFLVVSNALLTAVLGLLLYQLVCFRQVEFLSGTDIEIYLGDALGEPDRLALIRARTPTSLRLSIGDHQVVVKDVATQGWIDSQSVNVPSMLKELKLPTTWINPRVKSYEKVD